MKLNIWIENQSLNQTFLELYEEILTEKRIICIRVLRMEYEYQVIFFVLFCRALFETINAYSLQCL